MRPVWDSIVLVTIMAVVSAAPLWGQTPDSSVFHRRQWGVDFNIGSGFAGAGLIHFSSATRALVLNVSGDVSTSIPDDTSSTGGNSSQITISLGARRYHPVAPHLLLYRTLGIEGSYEHEFRGGASPVTDNSQYAGLFGEMGASWLVTPHLALGAAWRLSADYQRADEKTGQITYQTHSFILLLGQPRLTGQLYF